MSERSKKRQNKQHQTAKRAEAGKQKHDEARKLTLHRCALVTEAIQCSVANEDEYSEGDQTNMEHSEPLLRVVAHHAVENAQTGVRPAVEKGQGGVYE